MNKNTTMQEKERQNGPSGRVEKTVCLRKQTAAGRDVEDGDLRHCGGKKSKKQKRKVLVGKIFSIVQNLGIIKIKFAV